MPQSFSGIVSGALAFGSDLVVIKPRRSIGTFAAQVTLEESHSDQLEISDHPVQQGASITDHAYKRPAELTIKCGWSNSPASASALGGVIGAATATTDALKSMFSGTEASYVAAVYEKLLALQASRVPFDVYTGKRKYVNMLVQGLFVVTSPETEHSLMVTAQLRQVIIVALRGATATQPPASRQQDPGVTQEQVNTGKKSPRTTDSFDTGALQ